MGKRHPPAGAYRRDQPGSPAGDDERGSRRAGRRQTLSVPAPYRAMNRRFSWSFAAMSGSTPYYIRTPIYYVNDAPHIGHAYTTLACDVLARFKRLDGYRVMFLTGTDEHGQKVEKSAQAAGMDPQAFTDKVSQNFRDLADYMNYSYDQFIRTTEPRHIEASQIGRAHV